MSNPDKERLTDAMMSFWPSLPFMAFGLWTAWVSLAYSGSMWLSDSEVNGIYLSQMYIYSTLACGITFLVSGLFGHKRKDANPLSSSKLVLVGGLLASFGCFIIVLIGPFYLGSLLDGLNLTATLFMIGSTFTGIGTAVIGLRCGCLYGMLPPRRALIYASLSQLVACFVFLFALACPDWAPVEHGPSLVGILAFCLLPLLASMLACLNPSKASGVIDVPVPRLSNLSCMPGAFWRFAAFTFIVSALTAMMRAEVVTTHALASTLAGNTLLTLLRAPLAALIILYAVRGQAQPAGLGRVCSLVTVFLATATACVAAFGGMNNALSLMIYFTSSVIELLTWCLLAFIVAQKRISPMAVFGIGRGTFILGAGLGWMVGTVALPFLPGGTTTTLFFLVVAGVTLMLSMGLFSERDFERLFSQVSEDELSLDDLFDIEAREARLAAERRAEKRGRFSIALEAMTTTYNLSTREAEVLRCLAMGYGSDRVAETVGIKVNTVRVHTHNLYVKLDVHSREELMKFVDKEVARVGA